MPKHPGEPVIVFDAPSQRPLAEAVREIAIPQVVQPGIFMEPTPRATVVPTTPQVSLDDNGLVMRPGSSWNEADASLDAARAGIMRYSAARAIAVAGEDIEPETYAAAIALSQVVQSEMFVVASEPWPPLFRLVATINEYATISDLAEALDQYLTRVFSTKWFRIPLPCNPISFTYDELAEGVGPQQMATLAEFMKIVSVAARKLPTQPSHVILQPGAYVENQ